jgi:S-DNA-T family DNA segregation ATPase FtsK/SpoIIIE
VTDREIESVVGFLKTLDVEAETVDITHDDESGEANDSEGSGSGYDALYDQAVDLVCRERKASTSYLQRHFQVGYNRAARMIDRMEADGVISASNAVGRREVLAPGRRI